MSNLPEQVDQSVHTRKLFRRGQKILIAVSGGVDSMVLLHLLHELSQKNKWRLTVAHLNHQLRGSSSDADERLVARTAKKLGLPIVTGRADVKKIARTGHLSLEMAARKARHEFLAQTAAHLKISHIALAHHADDQVELFFLRLLRGSGSEGLAGMKWRSPSPANPAIQLIRPLLEQSKASLQACAAAKKIPFREDASNEWLDIQRNLIRRELLPLLRRKYQPALERTILRLMDILKAESEYIHDAAENWQRSGTGVSPARFKFGKIPFPKLPLALQRRCIQSQLLQRGIPTDFALVERLRTSPGKSFTVVPQLAVSCSANGQLHFQSSPIVESKTDEVKIDLARRAGQVLFAGRKISWAIKPRRAVNRPRPHPRKEFFDADKIGPNIVLRHWRPGDRFQPIGMKHPVKLQDFFVNQKIPRARRHDLIVAATAQNEVFWVEDVRISEQFKLTSATALRLTWQWK
ncbi:MAG TPA: tRNA lysidine(34) synthetase TilS [Verrucomicrobiae bacterium]|nr:tRNA lysidine(34) synthetase TilS [Verrucomicrobiae bacterium]